MKATKLSNTMNRQNLYMQLKPQKDFLKEIYHQDKQRPLLNGALIQIQKARKQKEVKTTLHLSLFFR